MKVNGVQPHKRSFLPPGKISISSDGEVVRIEDLQVTDGLELNEAEMSISALPKLLKKLSNGELNVDLSKVLANGDIEVKRFKVTASKDYLNKLVTKISEESENIKVSEVELSRGSMTILGKLKVPLMPSIPFKVELSPEVNSSGELKLRIIRTSVMMLPLPSVLIPLVTTMLKGMGLNEVGSAHLDGDQVTLDLRGISFESVEISNESLLIEGKMQKGN